jgi:hypothetical protein
MCDINNLTAVPCGDNTPGTKQVGYMVPVSEITTMPAYMTFAAEGDFVKTTGDFSFSGAPVGKGYFREFPMLINKNSYSLSAVGGVGSKGWKETFTFVIAGVNAQQLEFVTRMLNIPGVFLVTDKVGVVHVIGRKDDPAYVETVEGGTGDGPESERILTVTVSGYTSRPMVYSGTIDITPNTP